MHLCWLNRPTSAHISYADGTQEYLFANGQRERHFHNGVKEVVYPNQASAAGPAHTHNPLQPFHSHTLCRAGDFLPSACVLGGRCRPWACSVIGPYTQQQPARRLYRGTRRDWAAVLIGFRAVRNNVSTGVPANLPGRHRSRGPQVGGVVVLSPDCAGSALLSVPISPITLDPFVTLFGPHLVNRPIRIQKRHLTRHFG